MRNALLDIVQHTHGLGFIDLVRINGDDKETTMAGIAEDRSVVVSATFHKALADFKGTFGMPNLSKLNVLLGIPEYAEGAKIEISLQERNDISTPVGLHFENATGDFKNDYRFMPTEQINDKVKNAKMRNVRWDVEIHPSAASIQRLKYQAQANSEELTFIAKTEGTDLQFYFGDHSTHAGNFVFEHDVQGELKRGWNWPVAQVMSILNLPGDIAMKFSDEGAAMITVDSGIAKYEYVLPAQQK